MYVLGYIQPLSTGGTLIKKTLLYFISLLLAVFSLVFSAFASEPVLPTDVRIYTTPESKSVVIATDSLEEKVSTVTNSNVVPYSNPTNLVYEYGRMIFDNRITYSVTPTKGCSLRIWIKNISGSVTLRVWKSNSFSNIYSNTFSSTEQDVEIVSSCSGGQYTVTVSGGF